MSREEGSFLECEKCGGPVDVDGSALEGWPFEWTVASLLTSRLQRAERVVEAAKVLDDVHRQRPMAVSEEEHAFMDLDTALQEWEEGGSG